MDVSLSPLTEKHISKTFSWVQDPELQKLFLMGGKVTWSGHKEYFRKVLMDSTQRIYAILVAGDHVGNCGLKHLSLSKKEGELWIYIGESSLLNKGIGQKAVQLLLREGFEVLGLEKICLHVADSNVIALRLYEKIGFCEVEIPHESDEWSKKGCQIIRMELNKRL